MNNSNRKLSDDTVIALATFSRVQTAVDKQTALALGASVACVDLLKANHFTKVSDLLSPNTKDNKNGSTCSVEEWDAIVAGVNGKG